MSIFARPPAALFAGGSTSGIFNAFSAAMPMIGALVIGMVVLALLILAFRWVMKLREKGKGAAFGQRLMGALRRNPRTVSDPAALARMEDLRKKFEDGISKYRSAGKDLYKLPWYLLVGPPASGKTEMVRHCNVGFPPGLQDYLQGVGGTMNMNWWFTNHGVVIDTAGKMLMQEVSAGETSEWKELLNLLKAARPLEPLNGMVLCIGVDSLIKDSANQIQEKAGTIARQLDVIQRTLDIRFPVYVLVTKCDLITGFREYFEKVTDPTLQHQMVGWSNPAELDTPFNPESVDQHIEQVRQRLIRRRYSLIADPVHTDDPQARRTDQVDSLFALPESLSRLSSRLRRYLELIFVAGEWSPKPLFLRGIYFTSSMRQGAELDEEVAKILGMSVDELPGGGGAEEKSYFIRDVLTAKVFKERGLVTRATNVNQQQRKRKLMALGTSIGVLAFLIVAALWSIFDFYSTIGEPTKQWKNIGEQFRQLSVVETLDGQPAVNAKADTVIGSDSVSHVGVTRRSLALAGEKLSTPLVIRPLIGLWHLMSDDLPLRSKKAHAAVFEQVALANMVAQARAKMSTMKGESWGGGSPGDATAVLAGLLNIERDTSVRPMPTPEKVNTKTIEGERAAANAPSQFREPLDAERFLRFILPEDRFKQVPPEMIAELQGVVEQTYATKDIDWPPTQRVGRDRVAVEKGVAAFNEYWTKHAVNNRLGDLTRLMRAITLFDESEGRLVTAAYELKSTSLTPARYASFLEGWNKSVRSLDQARRDLDKELEGNQRLKQIKDSKALTDELDREVQRLKAQADEEYREVLGEEPPMLTGLAAKLAGKAAESATKAGEQAAASAGGSAAGSAAADVIAEAKSAGKAWKTEIDRLRGELEKSRKEVKDNAIVGAVRELQKFFDGSGVGGKLLARASDGQTYVYAARAQAYADVNAALAHAAEEGVAWGSLKNKSEDAAGKIAASFSQANGRFSKFSKPGEANERWKSGDDGFEALVSRAAAKSARSAAIVPAGQAINGKAESVAQAVASISKSELSFKIPMIASGKLTIDRQYDPDAARLVLADLAYLATFDPSTAKEPAALDQDEMKTAATNAKLAAHQYREQYARYWTAEIATQLSVQSRPSWSEFRESLIGNGVDDEVQRELKKLAERSAAALAPELVEATLELSKWQSAMSEDAKADLSQASGPALSPWRDLPPDASGVRKRFGAMVPTEFAERYLKSFAKQSRSPNEAMGPLARYTAQVRLQALSVVGNELNDKWLELKGKVVGGGIPLTMTLDLGARDRPPQSVWSQLVKEYLESMPFGVGGPDGKTLADGARIDAQEVNEAVEKIFLRQAAQSQEQVARLRAWLTFVLNSPNVEPLTCGIAVVNSKQLYDPAPKIQSALKAENAAGKFNSTIVEVDKAAPIARSDAEAGELLTAEGVRVPGARPVRIAFNREIGDKKMVNVRALTTEWTLLELLAEPDAQPQGEDGKTWRVPVVFREGATVYYKWIELRFNIPVPPRKYWP